MSESAADPLRSKERAAVQPGVFEIRTGSGTLVDEDSAIVLAAGAVADAVTARPWTFKACRVKTSRRLAPFSQSIRSCILCEILSPEASFAYFAHVGLFARMGSYVTDQMFVLGYASSPS